MTSSTISAWMVLNYLTPVLAWDPSPLQDYLTVSLESPLGCQKVSQTLHGQERATECPQIRSPQVFSLLGKWNPCNFSAKTHQVLSYLSSTTCNAKTLIQVYEYYPSSEPSFFVLAIILHLDYHSWPEPSPAPQLLPLPCICRAPTYSCWGI